MYRRIALLLPVVLTIGGCFGPFAVTGQVVDQDGRPLSDVKLHTTASVQTRSAFDTYAGERGGTLSNGKFRVSCATCTAMHLLFTRDGYHPKAVDLAFYEWWGDLTIVLNKRGPPVDLITHTGTLNAGPGYVDTVLAFPDDQTGPLTLSRVSDKAEATRYLSLLPATDAEGNLLIDRKLDMDVIRYADLDFSPANGVAQLYDPTDISFTYAYAEMITAPADGYTPRIRLQNKAVGQYFYFYCRIDGHYCKGSVSAPGVWRENGQPQVQVMVEMFVNPAPHTRGLDDPNGYLH